MLGVSMYTEVTDIEHDNSKLSTERLCSKIIERNVSYEPDIQKKNIKNKIKFLRLSL